MSSWITGRLSGTWYQRMLTLYLRCRYLITWPVYFGSKFHCPLCDKSFRRLRHIGTEHPVFRQVKMVGTGWREAQCTYCTSSDRERLVYLFCRDRTDLFRSQLRLLHVAPEIGFGQVLRKLPNLEYVSADLYSRRATIRTDLTCLPFGDVSFDAVICNHVLGYIRDESQALSEIERVLTPGGWTILQVGIGLELPETLEGVSVAVENTLIVRLYGGDYTKRLQNAGFETQVFRSRDEFSPEELKRYCLLPDEELYFSRKKPVGVTEQSKRCRPTTVAAI